MPKCRWRVPHRQGLRAHPSIWAELMPPWFTTCPDHGRPKRAMAVHARSAQADDPRPGQGHPPQQPHGSGHHRHHRHQPPRRHYQWPDHHRRHTSNPSRHGRHDAACVFPATGRARVALAALLPLAAGGVPGRCGAAPGADPAPAWGRRARGQRRPGWRIPAPWSCWGRRQVAVPWTRWRRA